VGERTDHVIDATGDEDIPLVNVLEVILVGVASSKDLPGNPQARLPRINFEHHIQDGRNVHVKVARLDGYWVIYRSHDSYNMSLIANEVKLESHRPLKSGVTVIVTNVPKYLTTGPDGEEIKGDSIGVAARGVGEVRTRGKSGRNSHPRVLMLRLG
jgi:hypothetical protein